MRDADKNHKRLFFIFLVIMVTAEGALCFFFTGQNPSAKDLSRAYWKTVILYGNDDPQDLKILEERLDRFYAKRNYTVTKENGCIALRLPLSQDQNNDDLKEYLEYFLIEPGARNICCAPPEDTRIYNTLYTIAQINPETCMETRTEKTANSGDRFSEDENTGIPIFSLYDSPANRFIIRLDDKTSAIAHEKVDSGSEIYLLNNMVYSDYKTNDLLQESFQLEADPNDPCLFFINYSPMSILNDHVESLSYNLQHDALSHPFNYCIQDEIDWADPGDSSFSGTFQVPEEELGDSWFFFQAHPYSRPSADEREEIDRFLTRRLDFLESPYAVGHTPDGAVCVKTTSQRLNKNIIDLLLDMDGHISLYVPSAQLNMEPEYADFRFHPDTGAIELAIPEEDLLRIQDKVQQITQTDSVDLYLKTETDSGPIARTKLTIPASNDILLFEELAFDPQDSSDQDFTWFIDLLRSAAESSDSDLVGFQTDYYYKHEPGQDTWNDPEVFPLKSTGFISIDEVKQKIRAVLPQAEIRLSENSSSLKVDMHLKADDTLPERIFELVPDILEAASLENSYYDNLHLDICDDSDDHMDERDWINISREPYGSDYSDSGIYLHFTGYLFNGRMDSYADRILELQKSDSFFDSMILEPEFDGWRLRDFD